MVRENAKHAEGTNDEWARVGEYLDRLAFESDRLEAELKIKKERRLARENAVDTVIPRARAFDEARETARYEARTASDTTENMRLSYDALKSDLSGLMTELADFKHSRAGLESRLQS